jgi:GNAT superfamily N-acetyltransferase
MTLAGVRHWGHHETHPEAYAGLAGQVEAADGPEKLPVFVLEIDGEVVGFYELRDRGDHVELLRMFMRSDLIGHGYGRKLWNHAIDQAAHIRDRMLIMSDPGAIDFYSAMGATLEGRQEVAPDFSLGVLWYDLSAN